jgi:hypothetical protein
MAAIESNLLITGNWKMQAKTGNLIYQRLILIGGMDLMHSIIVMHQKQRD